MMDDKKNKFGDSLKCQIIFPNELEDATDSNSTPSLQTCQSAIDHSKNVHLTIDYNHDPINQKKIHKKKKIKLRPDKAVTSPTIDPTALNSTYRYYIDIENIAQHLHSQEDGPLCDKASIRDYFYCMVLNRCPPEHVSKEGIFQYSFRSFYNLIQSFISNIQKQNKNLFHTLPGFEGKYSFEDVSMVEVHQFLVNCDAPDTNENNEDSMPSSQSQGHDDTFTDNDHTFEFDDSSDTDMNDDPAEVEDKSFLELQEELKKIQDNCIFSKTELAMMDLHELLLSCGAPMYLFDELMNWTIKYAKTFTLDQQPPKRKTFIETISNKVYGNKLKKKLQPKKVKTPLKNEEQIDVNLFDVKAQLISLLNDDRLMHHSNLLLDCNDPHKLPPEDCPLGDLNTGKWQRETHEELCKYPYEVLLPFLIFIDAGRVTGRNSVEPVTFTLGIFKRWIRYLVEAWRNLGYIENQKNVKNKCKRNVKQKKSTIKLENYHTILDKILKSLKELQGEDGGFWWDLKLNGKTFRVKFKIAVQVVLGDCQGLDKLCGHFGGSHPRMKLLCRDCNVPPAESDDPRHHCVFIKKEDLENKTKAQLKLISKHPIKNAMFGIYFGGNNRSIFDCSPPEPLHQYLYGTVKYLVIEFISEAPSTTIKLINSTVKTLYQNFSKQSDRHYPDFSAVQNGITFCDTLSALEQYGRLFAIFLALTMPEVFMSLCNDIRKSAVKDPKTKKNKFVKKNPMGVDKACKWKCVIELTLIMYQVIMKDEHDREFLKSHDSNTDTSAFQELIREFMGEYAKVVKRESKNGLKIKKFHSLLHYARQIRDSGSIRNVDTGRCESIAVSMYKRPSKLTQRRLVSLNEQISQRYVEGMVMDEARRLYCKKTKNFKFTKEHFNENVSKRNCLSGSKYHIEFTRHNRERKVHFKINWDAKNCNLNFDKGLTTALVQRLFIHWGHGGCVSEESKVTCHTEYIDERGNIYRAHPDYNGSGKSWYDWCDIEWEKDSTQPAKLLCFLDLRDVKFLNSNEQHKLRSWMQTTNETDRLRMLSNKAKNFQRQEYLENDIFAVICSGLTKSEEEDRKKPNQRKPAQLVPQWYKKFMTTSRIVPEKIMLEESFRIVKVSNIFGPIYCLPTTMRNIPIRNQYFFKLVPMSNWSQDFIDDYQEEYTSDLFSGDDDETDVLQQEGDDHGESNNEDIVEIEETETVTNLSCEDEDSSYHSSEGSYRDSSEDDFSRDSDSDDLSESDDDSSVDSSSQTVDDSSIESNSDHA